jgi:hypothetical protein
MSRELTPTMETALAERSVRPVLIGRLDIVGDPVFAWTGPGIFAPTGSGDAALDGIIFDPADSFVNISAVTEDQGIGGPVTITATANAEDEPLLRQVVRDRRQWRGQPAYLWLGLLNADESAVLNHPTRIKTGVITNMIVNREADSVGIDVVIDADLGNSQSAPFRITDHRRFYPDDDFTRFMINLGNRPRPPERGSSGGGAGGPVFNIDLDRERRIRDLLTP